MFYTDVFNAFFNDWLKCDFVGSWRTDFMLSRWQKKTCRRDQQTKGREKWLAFQSLGTGKGE